MISNSWGRLDLYCGNNHEEEVMMQIREKRGDAIYQCPHCKNFFSSKDVEKMLDKIEKIVSDAEKEGESLDIKNLPFTVGKCKYKVLEDEKRLKIKGVNAGAFGK